MNRYQILRQLCNYKGVEIIEGHLMPDHIHMLVSIPPKYSVSQFMGYLKGKSSLMIFAGLLAEHRNPRMLYFVAYSFAYPIGNTWNSVFEYILATTRLLN